MAEGTDRLDKTPEEVYQANILALSDHYEEGSSDSSPDVIHTHEDERLIQEILVEDQSEEDAISEDEEQLLTEATSTCSSIQVPRIIEARNGSSDLVSVTMSECTEDAVASLSGRRPLTSVVAAELITSSELPECHADVPLPDGAISNQQQLYITDYLDRVIQTVEEDLVSLQRQQSQWMARNLLEGRERNEDSLYPSLGNLSPTSSPRKAGVPRRPSVDPPGGSTHLSPDPQDMFEDGERAARRPDPPEVDPRAPPAMGWMQASTASPLRVFLKGRVSVENQKIEDSNDASERSPSPVLWQVRHLEERRRLEEEIKSEKRSHEGSCPLPALDRQWTRGSGSTSLGRTTSADPPSMEPDDARENTTTSRPDPPAVRMAETMELRNRKKMMSVPSLNLLAVSTREASNNRRNMTRSNYPDRMFTDAALSPSLTSRPGAIRVVGGLEDDVSEEEDGDDSAAGAVSAVLVDEDDIEHERDAALRQLEQALRQLQNIVVAESVQPLPSQTEENAVTEPRSKRMRGSAGRLLMILVTVFVSTVLLMMRMSLSSQRSEPSVDRPGPRKSTYPGLNEDTWNVDALGEFENDVVPSAKLPACLGQESKSMGDNGEEGGSL
jgi:hypothetical protein